MSFQFHIVRRTLVLAALGVALLVALISLSEPPLSHAVLADVRGSDALPVSARGTDVAAVDQQSPRSPDAEVAARPKTSHGVAAALAQERYYSSYDQDAPSDATAALAQERYYSSYGENVEPLSGPEPARLADNRDEGIAPLPFVISLLGALLVGAAAGSAVHVLRGRHAARVAT